VGVASFVIPAKAGIQSGKTMSTPTMLIQTSWIPAFAGMTGLRVNESDKHFDNRYKLSANGCF
jgi:hypothetical protein